jgi:signal transduction histidine kinase
MFQMFKRGSNVQNIPGSGLGLVVVNNAIKRHNGSITFESEVNRGTRFVIRLPVSQTYYRQSNVG